MKVLKGLEHRSQEEEMRLASRKGRQPFCVYCQKPLDRINHTQFVFIDWVWDKEKKKYIICSGDGDAEKPYCANCGVKDWDFIDSNLVDF
jgi:hypothetical protein